jgi:hypothetical protein
MDHLCHTADLGCRGGAGDPHRRHVGPWCTEPVTHRENTDRSRRRKAAMLWPAAGTGLIAGCPVWDADRERFRAKCERLAAEHAGLEIAAVVPAQRLAAQPALF